MVPDNRERGIWKWAVLFEINVQANWALMAHGELKTAMDQYGDSEADSIDASDEIWRAVQDLLVACANISKLLWADSNSELRRSRGVDVERDDAIRSELRECLAQDEDSPLRRRGLRNHFEHFDERIARWASAARRSRFSDRTVRRIGNGWDAEDDFRSIDDEARVVTFQGENFDLEELIASVKRLHERIGGCMRET